MPAVVQLIVAIAVGALILALGTFVLTLRLAAVVLVFKFEVPPPAQPSCEPPERAAPPSVPRLGSSSA